MKRILSILLQVILLSACVPLTLQQSTPFPTLTPSLQPTVIITPATVTPTITPTQALPTATSTVIALEGPKLELGSTYQYVDGTTLVAVPEGEFEVGASGVDNPLHTVKLSQYWIYQTEVTNSQFARCVAASKCTPPDPVANKHYTDPLWANDPVAGVNYDQAISYCSSVNASLPTEAQWEKAARGPDGNRFPWGNTNPSCDLLNYNYCVGQTTDVSTHLPGKSYYGAADMSGNVFEWVVDWYDPAYYASSSGDDPAGPSDGGERVVRSSSYESGADESMPSKRYSRSPGEYSVDLGFRCVVQSPTYFAPFCQQNVLYSVDTNGESVVTNSPNPVCAELGMNMGQSCGPGGRSQTVVTFKGPSGATVSAPNCIQDSQSDIYTCYDPVQASICVDCTLPNLGQPQCGNGHYQVDGGLCRWDGTPTLGSNCLETDTYDPANRCCTPGSTHASQCPVGFYFLEKQKGCVPYPAQSTYCLEKTVELKPCK